MTLHPVLFSADARLVSELATDHGFLEAVVVDWERSGKAGRQHHALSRIGTDTQISSDTETDLWRVSRDSLVPVWCRVNTIGGAGPGSIAAAIAGGADEVLIPMVRTVEDAERALEAAAGQVGVGVLIETSEAVDIVAALAALPLTRAYVGLMDLALDRGSTTIFEPFLDGTLELLRGAFAGPLGVAGLTVPWGGAPVPSRLLAGEIVRLGYDFSLVRRSFIRDASGDPRSAFRSVRQMLAELDARTAPQIDADQASFAVHIEPMLV